jgi:hypothetical protein
MVAAILGVRLLGDFLSDEGAADLQAAYGDRLQRLTALETARSRPTSAG